MNYQVQDYFAHGDGSGLLVLFAVASVTVMLTTLSRFYLARASRKRALKTVLNSNNKVKNLTSYEQLRIKDGFDREIRTRHLEDYEKKSGDVGSNVFYAKGAANQHSFSTVRGTIFSYTTISGLEMLVPTAAVPYLKDEDNYVEFVMVGDLAFVIRLNEKFELVPAASEKEQPRPEVNAVGDSNILTRLSPKEISDSDVVPSNTNGYLKSIRGDRLLVSDSTLYASDLKLLFGFYWLVLFLLCGFAPLVTVVFGALGGFFSRSLELGMELFLYTWPFGEFVLWTLPFALVFWVVYRWTPSGNYVVVFDRKDKQVLFCPNQLEPTRVNWKDLYSLVETVDWMTPYGYPMSEIFLELASDNRDCENREWVRLKYSHSIDALGSWHAIQAFMNGDLQTLQFHHSETVNSQRKKHETRSSAVFAECLAHEKPPSVVKKMASRVLYCLLGGPLPYWLTSWVSRQRTQLFWLRAS